MKKILFLLIIACSLKARAQTDTINYIVVYRDSAIGNAGLLTLSSTASIAGFKTQVTLANFLNNSIDSAALISIFDVRTRKPLAASSSTVIVDRVVTVKDRQRKWNIK